MEGLIGVELDTEIVVATEHPQGSWIIDHISVEDSEGDSRVLLHCDPLSY